MATGENRNDPAKLTNWFSEYSGELQSFLYGVLRNDDLASEALQATLVRAVEQGHTARPETRRGWLFRVALNEALIIKRKGKIQEKSFRELAQADARRHESSGGSETRNESPVGALLRVETIERVKMALNHLTIDQQRVVRMRIYENKTFAQIAQELGIPLGTALTRMRLAMEKLQELLGDLS